MQILYHQNFITDTDNIVYLGMHVLADIKLCDFQPFNEILVGIQNDLVIVGCLIRYNSLTSMLIQE